MWKKIERVGVEHFPYFLKAEDICYYARDFISHGGYSASDFNQLISNLKKPVSAMGRQDWGYRNKAVNQLSREIPTFIGNYSTVYTSIPSSKPRNHPEHNHRLEEALEQFLNRNNTISVEYPFDVNLSSQPVHAGGERNPDCFYDTLVWSGFSKEYQRVILVDDIITSGAHFKACQRILLENCPNIIIIGLFWGKTAWPDTDF